MQTQSANYFVDAALALDDDVQFAIYAIIQGPMTQIANESQISREDILRVLQLTDLKAEHNDPSPDIEQVSQPIFHLCLLVRYYRNFCFPSVSIFRQPLSKMLRRLIMGMG